MTNLNLENTRMLDSGTTGKVYLPDSDGYDEARKIWNGMFDRKPAIIIQCKSTSDVVASVNFARDNKLILAVKGGGHHSAGTSVCDDGVMIDLSLMNKVSVKENVVIAQGGCLLSDVDGESIKHGLAVPGGVVSHTGVGGLTLGGGFGWISRKFGLTISFIRFLF